MSAAAWIEVDRADQRGRLISFIPEIFGHKSVALFDLWSLIHFLSGFGIVTFLAVVQKFTKPISHPLVWCLAVSAVWEIIEIYLELGLAGQGVAFWFDGLEHWANRLITDQVLFVLGFMVGAARKALVLPAKIFSTGWLLFHIFALPHSMYLQEIWF